MIKMPPTPLLSLSLLILYPLWTRAVDGSTERSLVSPALQAHAHAANIVMPTCAILVAAFAAADVEDGLYLSKLLAPDPAALCLWVVFRSPSMRKDVYASLAFPLRKPGLFLRILLELRAVSWSTSTSSLSFRSA